MGTLVLINFALVVTLFPAIVVLLHKWSARRRDRRDAKSAAAANGDRISPRAAPLPSPRLDAIPGDGAPDIAPDDVTPAVPDAPAAVATPPLRRGSSVIGASWTQRVERFLAGPYLRVLLWLRPVVFVGAAALLGGAAYSVTQLTPSDRDFTYETFHHDTNLMRAINQFEEAWGGVETDSPWLDVVWGVDGLDRAASDPNDPFDAAARQCTRRRLSRRRRRRSRRGAPRVRGRRGGGLDRGRPPPLLHGARARLAGGARPPVPDPRRRVRGRARNVFDALEAARRLRRHRRVGGDAAAAPAAAAAELAALASADYVPWPGRPSESPSSRRGARRTRRRRRRRGAAVTGEGVRGECRAFFGTAAAHRDGKVWALGWAAHLRSELPADATTGIIELNADGSTADASYTADLTHRWCHCLDADDALNAANEVAKIGGLGAPGDFDSMSEEERAAAFSRKPGDYAGACPPSAWRRRRRGRGTPRGCAHSRCASGCASRTSRSRRCCGRSSTSSRRCCPRRTRWRRTSPPCRRTTRGRRCELSAVMLTLLHCGCVLQRGRSSGGAVLVLCLGNWLVALLAIAHVCFVIACSIAAMVWFGWQVGFIEACMINLVAGFSVDFVAHLAIAVQPCARRRRLLARGRSRRSASSASRSPPAASPPRPRRSSWRRRRCPFSKLGGFMIAEHLLLGAHRDARPPPPRSPPSARRSASAAQRRRRRRGRGGGAHRRRPAAEPAADLGLASKVCASHRSGSVRVRARRSPE